MVVAEGRSVRMDSWSSMDLAHNYGRKNHADKQDGKNCTGLLLRHR
jgi:hypothetical protein